MIEPIHFDNSESVLRYIQERSDDIKKVVIPQHPFISVFDPNDRTKSTEIEAGLVVHLLAGNFHIVHPTDAEIVLNDGILNRMKIRIELGR